MMNCISLFTVHKTIPNKKSPNYIKGIFSLSRIPFFFHPDYTVGTGISPVRATFDRFVGYTTDMEFHHSLKKPFFLQESRAKNFTHAKARRKFFKEKLLRFIFALVTKYEKRFKSNLAENSYLLSAKRLNSITCFRNYN
jgi:hypothetical protein